MLSCSSIGVNLGCPAFRILAPGFMSDLNQGQTVIEGKRSVFEVSVLSTTATFLARSFFMLSTME